MKRYYFSFNNITNEYYLDLGAFSSRRLFLGQDKDFLIKYFKKNVNLRRKAEFIILKEGIDKNVIKNIEKFFSNSKVKISFDSILNIGNFYFNTTA